MVVAVILLLILTFLLLPVYFAVNCNMDIDGKYMVILVRVLGLVVVDIVITLDGVNVSYQGTINGSVSIIDVRLTSLIDMLTAVSISRVNCDIYYGVSCMSGIHNAVTIGLITVVTSVTNKITTISALTQLHVGDKNMALINVKGNITILSLVVSVMLGGLLGKLHN